MHASYLVKRYSFIPLELVRKAFIEKDPGIFPPNSLLITFDDGLKSNCELLGVFKNFRIRPTIFLPTGLVGTNRKIWTRTLDRHSAKENEIYKRLISLPNAQKDKELFNYNRHYYDKEYPEREILNEAEIGKMLPHVDFQSHGITHAIFTKCSDQELRQELTESKKKIENLTGKECFAVAYPNGEFGQREIMMAEEAGYCLGREALGPGLNKPFGSSMALKAVSMKTGFSTEDVEKALYTGATKFLLNSLANSVSLGKPV
ncbi:MAG: polysaccharide deacetylase family protein [Candidatus Omnitrophota bacterium]